MDWPYMARGVPGITAAGRAKPFILQSRRLARQKSAFIEPGARRADDNYTVNKLPGRPAPDVWPLEDSFPFGRPPATIYAAQSAR